MSSDPNADLERIGNGLSRPGPIICKPGRKRECGSYPEVESIKWIAGCTNRHRKPMLLENGSLKNKGSLSSSGTRHRREVELQALKGALISHEKRN